MFVENDGSHNRLIEIFPNCYIDSPPTAKYNCVAWAISPPETHRPWWPNAIEAYWPNWEAENTLEAFELLFEELGYEPCDNEQLEVNFEKVAIYTDAHGEPSHVARQIISGSNSGFWTSKCGFSHDVIHHNLADLEGEDSIGRYGIVALIMKKSVNNVIESNNSFP